MRQKLNGSAKCWLARRGGSAFSLTVAKPLFSLIAPTASSPTAPLAMSMAFSERAWAQSPETVPDFGSLPSLAPGPELPNLNTEPNKWLWLLPNPPLSRIYGGNNADPDPARWRPLHRVRARRGWRRTDRLCPRLRSSLAGGRHPHGTEPPTSRHAMPPWRGSGKSRPPPPNPPTPPHEDIGRWKSN